MTGRRAQRAVVLGAGAAEAPRGESLNQPDDPARRAAAECDHAGEYEQEHQRAAAWNKRERQANQTEADRTARQMASDRGAGERAGVTVSHAPRLRSRSCRSAIAVPSAAFRVRDADATSSPLG